MRKNWVTIVLTAGALVAVLFFVFHQHQKSKEKVLAQFNESQFRATQGVADSIERYFRSRSQDLRGLAHISSRHAIGRDKLKSAVQPSLNDLRLTHIEAVTLLDEKGGVVYSSTAGREGEDHSQADFFSWARNPVNQGTARIWHRRMAVNAGSAPYAQIEILLVTPLYREARHGGHQQPGGKFTGALMFTIDLEKVLAERLPSNASLPNIKRLWIIDRGGTLLVHAGHPEMVMRDVRKRDKTCTECHTSFDYIEAILGDGEGTIEYQIKGHPKWVAAFAPMIFEKSSWIIVMNAPMNEVTAFERENLKDAFSLLGAVVFLLGIAFFSVYRNYRKQVAGEMEMARLRGNQLLMEKLRKTLGGTIQVVSRAVEMRDPYTAGHQRRVADLARAIAAEIGMSADGIDFVRIAGTIHDIGKISVPAEILSKPTKLSDIEFNLIKEHAQAGYDILKNIEFPWPVSDVVHQHHERMDGSGYPQGIKGGDLLLESRILAVADVVESMASHRPYRPALGIDAALEEIKKNRTVLYDPEVVDICLQLFREKGYRLVD